MPGCFCFYSLNSAGFRLPDMGALVVGRIFVLNLAD